MELARGAPSLDALTEALEEDFPKEALGAPAVRELLADASAALDLKVGRPPDEQHLWALFYALPRH